MTDAGFFRGTSADQDFRFANKHKKLLKELKFSPILNTKIHTSDININKLKPWIEERIKNVLELDDELLSESIFEHLAEKEPDGRDILVLITGFVDEDRASKFMEELWTRLIELKDSSGNGTTPEEKSVTTSKPVDPNDSPVNEEHTLVPREKVRNTLEYRSRSRSRSRTRSKSNSRSRIVSRSRSRSRSGSRSKISKSRDRSPERRHKKDKKDHRHRHHHHHSHSRRHHRHHHHHHRDHGSRTSTRRHRDSSPISSPERRRHGHSRHKKSKKHKSYR